MSKFKNWLDGNENVFDKEIEIIPIEENKQSIKEIATKNVLDGYEKQKIIKTTIKRTSYAHLFLSLVTFSAYIALLILMTSFLPKFGDTNFTWNYVSKYYIENALTDTKSINVVAGMILDYRAFDTLGESFVLFSAVTCVFILLDGLKDETQKRRKGFTVENDPIVKVAATILIPIIFIFGIYIVLNGHLSPGGGFSGGAILGAGFILYSLAFGDKNGSKFISLKTFKTVSAIALFGYSFLKCYSFLMGGMHFNDPIAHFFHSLADGSILSGGYILILNICVGAVVACTMYGFYSLFKKGEI